MSSLQDQGTRVGKLHGVSHIGAALPEELVGGLFDTTYQIIENVRACDQDVIALDADILRNATRKSFVDAWEGFYQNWRAFYTSHTSLLGLAYHGGRTTRVQTDEYRARLNGWFAAYQAEVPNAPLGAMQHPSVSLFAPDAPDRWDTSTVVLLTAGGTLGGLLLAGYLGYATYRYFRSVKAAVGRVEAIGGKVAMVGAGKAL